MTGLNRWQLITAFLALMVLRMVIGYHFFHEGTKKIRDGNFDSSPFLTQAKGPLSQYYHRLLDDPDGHWRLCIKDTDQFGQPIEPVIDTEIVFAVWKDFIEQADTKYRFGDSMLLDVLNQKASKSNDPVSQDELKKNIEKVSSQHALAKKVFESHQSQLNQFLNYNRLDILAYAKSAERLNGFARDGENRQAVANQVASLGGQVDAISKERKSKNREWFASVEAIWNSFEFNINELAIEDQRNGQPLELHRPYELNNSMLRVVNQVIPWFDTIIGALLLVGLLTRFASLFAALFLVSVVLSQPFWVAGTQDTWMQWFELCGLAVIFATCAGRYGGLDYFLHRILGKSRQSTATEAVVA